jgi:hypothetical protein
MVGLFSSDRNLFVPKLKNKDMYLKCMYYSFNSTYRAGLMGGPAGHLLGGHQEIRGAQTSLEYKGNMVPVNQGFHT